MILLKNSNLLYRLFLLKIDPEMMFGNVLDRKKAFLENKNMYLICPKNRKFSKRQTIELSSWFVFIKNGPRNDVWGCSR